MACLPAAAQTISTVAGDGTLAVGGSGDTGVGDGGPATSAPLNAPSFVALDSAGSVYFPHGSTRIRKVDAGGTISTVAGNGTEGNSGDGGPAISAELNYPTGIAVDSAGNLYTVIYMGPRVRRVDGSGTISTVAGDGSWGASGDGGPATSAQLNYPQGMAVDSAGNLYIADAGNHRIRKVDIGSGTISTVAGTGTPGPAGDGGPAAAAQLRDPSGVFVDGAGNLYIADSGNHRVRKVDAGGAISTVAGTGTGGYNGDGIAATSAQLNYPYDVAVDSAGNVFVADLANERVRKVDTGGTISTVAGTGTAGYNGDGIAATSAQLNTPLGVALDSAGNLYIADANNSRIRKVTAILPGSPLGVSATAGNARVSVNWTAPLPTASPVVSYTVTASNGATCTATAPATTCTVTGLTNGTPYTFRVVASSAGGTSLPSAASEGVAPEASGASVVAVPTLSAWTLALLALGLGGLAARRQRR